MSTRGGVSRGQSEVLGTVLLIGIVILGSLAVAGMAFGAFGGTQEQSDREAIEHALLDIRSAAAAVAMEGETSRTIQFHPPEGAQVSMTDKGSITIEHIDWDPPNETEPEILHEVTDLGGFEVQYGDVSYAFEGGGIFRYEDGQGHMVSPPHIAYRDLTATIPILRVEGAGAKAGPTQITISPGEHIRPAYPDPEQTYEGDANRTYDNPVMEGSINITVQSKYYEGWAQFFRQYTDGHVWLDHENETVIAELASLEELPLTDPVTYVTSYDERGSAGTSGSAVQTEFLPDSNEIIDGYIEEASEENNNDLAACIDDDNLYDGDDGGCDADSPLVGKSGEDGAVYYFADDVYLDEDLYIDTTDGNVTIVVDGHFHIQAADINVTDDSGNVVEYYIKDSFDVQGDVHVGTAPTPVQSHRNTLIIGGDAFDEPGDGTVTLDAIIYAPNADIDTAGNIVVNGAIYANSMTLRGNFNIEYDQDLEGQSLDLTGWPTPIMFMHLTENTAVFEID